ncbi:MAG: gliding motility-associated C-terminal domain-containing protein, partial [Flavobacteriales bacterium]|nr:gliding motility-associated C-terminal domain-containing protein [Flavobacteriales bacterium]
TDIFLFYIPNSFTPNDDGTNDVFRAYGEGIDLSNFKMYVFDRWGEKIFETDDITDGWDGTYRGSPVANGVYVWRIETKELFVNKRHEIMGHVNLFR